MHLALVGRPLLSKALIQLSAEGWGCTPSLIVVWPEAMRFDFIVIEPILLSHCGFFFIFRCGYLFLVESSILLSMIFLQLSEVLVLSQEEISAHPSILSSEPEASRLIIFNIVHFLLK